ncbi:myb-related transcription factor, partner of profilin-like [Rhinatrema bivittatum]|uniref:myb-related transcription factor, partner of profilin-like n=1 Tax=Rhinatrema bivittatum TaxID=194408 RepID=UPI00112E4E9E|nr:myb-related transcription factor, partner of profilin-like [Rhinatrema bivittatum]
MAQALPDLIRKPNFMPAEVDMLVEHVIWHRDLLYGPQSRTVGAYRKEQIWRGIRHAVNSVFHHNRSTGELMHKWRDMRRLVKCKQARRLAEGEQSHITFSASEQLILGTISEAAVGSVGQLDTMRRIGQRANTVAISGTALSIQDSSQGCCTDVCTKPAQSIAVLHFGKYTSRTVCTALGSQMMSNPDLHLDDPKGSDGGLEGDAAADASCAAAATSGSMAFYGALDALPSTYGPPYPWMPPARAEAPGVVPPPAPQPVPGYPWMAPPPPPVPPVMLPPPAPEQLLPLAIPSCSHALDVPQAPLPSEGSVSSGKSPLRRSARVGQSKLPDGRRRGRPSK